MILLYLAYNPFYIFYFLKILLNSSVLFIFKRISFSSLFGASCIQMATCYSIYQVVDVYILSLIDKKLAYSLNLDTIFALCVEIGTQIIVHRQFKNPLSIKQTLAVTGSSVAAAFFAAGTLGIIWVLLEYC